MTTDLIYSTDNVSDEEAIPDGYLEDLRRAMRYHWNSYRKLQEEYRLLTGREWEWLK